MNSLPAPWSHKADSLRKSEGMWRLTPSLLPHLLSFHPPAVWFKGALVVIAFKSSLGSRPGIFQLWSAKPITHLLREGRQSCVDEFLCVKLNLCHLELLHRSCSEVMPFVLWIISTSIQNKQCNLCRDLRLKTQLVGDVVFQCKMRQTTRGMVTVTLISHVHYSLIEH